MISTFKAIIRPYWNMQTPYGALSDQTPTSRNCKPFRTQLCSLLLAIHATQTFKAYKTKPVSYQWAPISNSKLHIFNE